MVQEKKGNKCTKALLRSIFTAMHKVIHRQQLKRSPDAIRCVDSRVEVIAASRIAEFVSKIERSPSSDQLVSVYKVYSELGVVQSAHQNTPTIFKQTTYALCKRHKTVIVSVKHSDQITPRYLSSPTRILLTFEANELSPHILCRLLLTL